MFTLITLDGSTNSKSINHAIKYLRVKITFELFSIISASAWHLYEISRTNIFKGALNQ